MDGWMVRSMAGWMVGWIDSWMDGFVVKRMVVWLGKAPTTMDI